MSSSIRQEPHRVYWQQLASAPTTDGVESISQQQQHQVVTKSAAVRISDEARAQDVTRLLQTSIATLQTQNESNENAENALVLVATLYHSNSVEFEHEHNKSTFACEPFHIIKTLQGNQSPLQVRDDLLQRIRQGHHDAQDTTSIAPKLQWFFVSCSSKEMPNYIQLDGYCTSDEEYNDSDDEDGSSSSSSDSDCENDNDEKSGIKQDDIDSTHWWRNQPCFVDVVPVEETDIRHHQQQNNIHSESKPSMRQLHKQQRRLQQLKLAQQQQSSPLDHHANNTITGFLLAQSRRNFHVWKQVDCVLTDEHLWTVSRLYSMDGMKMARRYKISLHGALVVQPKAIPNSPLSTIPHVFSVVSKSGTVYNFRASCQVDQDYWMQSISHRIQISHENEFLQHAFLICEHTTLARNLRMHALAIQPLQTTTTSTENENMMLVVLRWGMEVAEFRELCRHVASRIPNHAKVVVSTELNDNPTPKRLFASPPQNDENTTLDQDTQDMIGSAWDLAAILLARAVQYMHPTLPTTTTIKRTSSLDSSCRHIDYILTGQFRDMEDIVATSVNVKTRRSRSNSKNGTSDAPPIDLFDTLLAQLQNQLKGGGEKDKSESAIETPLSK